MQTTYSRKHFVVGFGAHLDDLEAVMGGATVKLVRKGLSVLFVDLCDGAPARHAAWAERHTQEVKAAEILGVERTTFTPQDRLVSDTVEARLEVARLLREPKTTDSSCGAGSRHDSLENVIHLNGKSSL
jgi:LmbE family N-acetylglucosaminyl deacetylase